MPQSWETLKTETRLRPPNILFIKKYSHQSNQTFGFRVPLFLFQLSRSALNTTFVDFFCQSLV